MSLINRVLGDLATRAPKDGDLMSGVEVDRATGKRRNKSGNGRLALLLVLAALLGGVGWWILQAPKAPLPRVPTQAVAAQTPQPPTVDVSTLQRFRMDDALGSPKAKIMSSAASAPPEPTALALTETIAAAPVAKPAQKTESSTPKRARATSQSAAEARRSGDHIATARNSDRDSGFSQSKSVMPGVADHQARTAQIVALLNSGRSDEAQRLLNEGLALAPNNLGYRRLSARLALERGDAQSAMQLLGTAPDGESRALRAAALQRLQRHPEAAAEYEALLRADSRNGTWWVGYGISLEGMGRKQDAVQAYRRAQSGPLDSSLSDHAARRIAALVTERRD